MNAPTNGNLGVTQQVVTQESLLSQTAERLGRIRDGWQALHFRLSLLRSYNRQESHLRIATRLFEPVVDSYRSQLFRLSNSDFMLLTKDAPYALLEDSIFKLRTLFDKDPVAFSTTEDGVDRFCTWYDLSQDYNHFLDVVAELDRNAQRKVQQQRERAGAEMRPMDSRKLKDVLARLGDIDLAPMVRRQSVIDVAAGSHAEVVFQEFFFSVGDIQQAVLPDANMLANRWLFQHLSQTLDQHMLAMLSEARLTNLPLTVSVNLNLQTTISDSFQDFVERMEKKAKIIVEVQLIDVFSDMGAFFFARDWLQERGHQIVLDGLNVLSLQFMNIADYGADFVKLNWSTDYTEGSHGDEVREALTEFGLNRTILARCDSEDAIRWGLKSGINRFQGRYVDAMLGAYTLASCPRAQDLHCTLKDCTFRRSVIAGGPRGECGNHPHLDGFPRIKALRR